MFTLPLSTSPIILSSLILQTFYPFPLHTLNCLFSPKPISTQVFLISSERHCCGCPPDYDLKQDYPSEIL